MQNTSGIHPKGHRVLILPDPVEEVTQSGIILSVGENRDRERQQVQPVKRLHL